MVRLIACCALIKVVPTSAYVTDKHCNKNDNTMLNQHKNWRQVCRQNIYSCLRNKILQTYGKVPYMFQVWSVL